MVQEKEMNKYLGLILCTFALSGCLTKEVPSFNTYSLSLNNSKPQTSLQTKDSLFVATPKTIASLNSTAIFYSATAHRQEAYALSKWSDTPAKMIQQLLTQKLSQTNTYRFVTSSKLKTRASITVNSELIEFKQYVNNNDSKVVLNIRVYKTKQNETVSKNFMYEMKSKRSAQGAVSAWNELVNQFLEDASLFIVE